MRLGPGTVRETEAAHRGVRHGARHLFGRIGDDQSLDVLGADRPMGQRARPQEVDEGRPEFTSNENDWELLDLAGR